MFIQTGNTGEALSFSSDVNNFTTNGNFYCVIGEDKNSTYIFDKGDPLICRAKAGEDR